MCSVPLMPIALEPLYFPSIPVTLVRRNPRGPVLHNPGRPGLEDLAFAEGLGDRR